MRKPCPTPLENAVSQWTVGEHRHLDCPFYDRCLDVAVAENWPGWTCMRCELRTAAGARRSVSEFANDRRRDPLSGL